MLILMELSNKTKNVKIFHLAIQTIQETIALHKTSYSD